MYNEITFLLYEKKLTKANKTVRISEILTLTRLHIVDVDIDIIKEQGLIMDRFNLDIY